jgi:GNAT superfamily N-acetyltransferase
MSNTMNILLRTALVSDYRLIERLIEVSIRKLGSSDYSPKQISAALQTAFGLDTQLIKDQTYFVVEAGQVLVGCGGWSYRETLFGNDSELSRNPRSIDPLTGAAKIRAFFVDPEFSRMGIGSMILDKCEQEALSAGFKKLELMATLPGTKLYEKHGYVAGEPIHYPLADELTIEFVPMYKNK